ncbi:MAG: sporulation protein YqfC [Paenibacillaceae bacterium]
MRRWRKSIRNLAVTIMDIPQDLIFDMPRITMIGNAQITIENHRGLDLFSSQLLRLRFEGGALEIAGENLVIRNILKNEVFIEGTIQKVEYIK